MQDISMRTENKVFSWPDNYYFEIKPANREKALKARIETEDSEENRIRYQLWEKRYTLPGKGVTGADYYMKVVMGMGPLCESRNSFFGKKAYRKGMQEIRNTFCLDLLKEKPQYADLWRKEFQNFWVLYMKSCIEDRNYSGIVMGMGQMSEDRLSSKLYNDIQQKTEVFPEKLGLAEELAQFRQAAWEIYYRYYPE